MSAAEAVNVQVHPFQADPDVPDYCMCGWHRESRCHGNVPMPLAEIARKSDALFCILQSEGLTGDAAHLIAALIGRVEILEQRVEELVLKGGRP